MTLIPKTKIIRDKEHLEFITRLMCVIDGYCPCDHAHIRSGFFCMKRKPGDNLTLPLCRKCHIIQSTKMSEKSFWDKYGGVDKAKVLANNLYINTGNESKALQLIEEFRR